MRFAAGSNICNKSTIIVYEILQMVDAVAKPSSAVLYARTTGRLLSYIRTNRLPRRAARKKLVRCSRDNVPRSNRALLEALRGWGDAELMRGMEAADSTYTPSSPFRVDCVVLVTHSSSLSKEAGKKNQANYIHHNRKRNATWRFLPHKRQSSMTSQASFPPRWRICPSLSQDPERFSLICTSQRSDAPLRLISDS